MAHRSNHRSWLLPAVLAFVLPWGGVIGCEGPAFVARVMQGEPKIPAQHTLEDRPTLVFVDDPDNNFGSAVLTGVVAANAAHHLRANAGITARFVPERDLSTLARARGSAFQHMPIDEIGRELGAEQVIYARVEQVYLQPAPTFYRPTARLEVKVIDTTTGKRVYPAPPPVIDPGAPARGRTLDVALRIRRHTLETPGADTAMARRLAEEAGLRLAQMFYEHAPKPPFEDD